MRLLQTVLVAGAVEVVILLGNVLRTFLTDAAGGRAWLAAPVVAAVVAVGKLLVDDAVRRRPAPAPATGSLPGPAPGAPVLPPRRGPGLGLALVVAVLVLGVGGYAVTAGVRYVTGRVTGNEPGVERLLSPTEGGSAGLKLTVTSVVHSRHFTRVGVTVANGTSNTVTLPVFSNAVLVDADGSTLEGDAFRSSWSKTVPPSGRQRGTLVFPGHLSEAPTTASLSFATVFAQGFDGPASVTVASIPLAALADAGG